MARASVDGPGQAVEFRHDQGVALADGGEGLIEAGPGAGGAGEAVIGVDAILGDAQLQRGPGAGRPGPGGRWNSGRIRLGLRSRALRSWGEVFG